MPIRAALLAIFGFIVFGWLPCAPPESSSLIQLLDPVKPAAEKNPTSLVHEKENSHHLEFDKLGLLRIFSELTKNLSLDDLSDFASGEIGKLLVERRLEELSSDDILHFFRTLTPDRTIGSRERIFLDLANKELIERRDYQVLADLSKCTKDINPQIRIAYQTGDVEISSMLEKLGNEDPVFRKKIKIVLRGGGSETPENKTRAIGGDVHKFADLLGSVEQTSSPDKNVTRNRCINQFAFDYPITAACNMDNFSPEDQKLIANRLNIWEILHSADSMSLGVLSASTNPYIAPKVSEILANMKGETAIIQRK